MKKLSHYDRRGRVKMVDVTAKPATSRTAVAHAFVRMQRATIASVRRLKSPKGNPLEIARIAGITAAKRTAELMMRHRQEVAVEALVRRDRHQCFCLLH